MNAHRCLAAVFVVVALAAGVRAERNDNADLLVGTWEVTKPDPNTLPVGAVVVFDGSAVTLTYKVNGDNQTVNGAYTVDGDALKVVTKVGDKEQKWTFTIKKINAISLSAQDDQNSVGVEFKRTK